ncbi:hypothetical protein IVB18_37940 [Bradyrhizobium sp. 186]|uniref:hypothetical protein n=1 Tax=Bradyrhizobium sp. 186 TaxID=2782654 RepID=UPI002001B4D9|nr:hypothetical protein [Bradyrhizobium sp. 186]UPK33910.1 hypothetical protein IVB18_37940 [Bradyrhizobium sp. 186]
MKIKTAAASLCFFAEYWLQARAATAGECVSRPERFVLLSDTVYWTVSIPSGTECLQGLRGKTQLLDEVKLVEAPSTGIVTIAGPSFRYQAPPSPGPDQFRISVSGENRRQRGSSVIIVEVTVR